MISKWGSVIAEMISGYGKSMLEKWVQGVGRPDHPTIISEMILRGGPVQPPECWGDDIALGFQLHMVFGGFLTGPPKTWHPNINQEVWLED